MRGVFDDEEPEPGHEGPDKELTLGSGTLLILFFGLVMVCGLCFGLGYSVGHRGVKPATAAAPAAAVDQEPLQASGTIPKPSAIAQGVVAQPVAAPTAGPDPAPAGAQDSAPGASPPASAPVTGTDAQRQQAQVHAALPAAVPAAILVQVAAVANPEDADVLVGALRKRNYAVTARRDAADNLIHVSVGPFATRAEADQWRMKLLNDGYNAVIQP